MPLSPDSLLSLRELLRCRRELHAEEVARLLAPLPEMLDRGEAASVASLINEVVVCFHTPPAGGVMEMAKLPVTSWPGFRLLAEEEQQDAGSTIVGGISVLQARPSSRLAALVYELLGGRVRYNELLQGRYSPLAELDEAGNDLLRKALSKRGYPDCRSFWREWIETVVPPAAEAESASAWQIPEHLLGCAQPGEVLELTPVERSAVPTRLVARGVFKIGRSRRLTDLPTRSADEGSGGAGDNTKELSRIHVLAERLPNGGIGLRDGNGERASSNGSAWNEATLSSKKPLPIVEPGMLLLSPASCRYRLEVAPFAVAPRWQTEIANLAAWKGAVKKDPSPPTLGAVVFRAPRGAMVVRQAVWLLAAIGAEIFPTGEFAWSDEDAPSHAFLHRHGCFWIANIAAPEPVEIDGNALGKDQVAPLAQGQVIELAGVKFGVEVM